MRVTRKFKRLKEIIRSMGSVLVAYSGGVDSTLLLKVASSVLPANKVLAVLATSPLYPLREVRFAKKMMKELGVRYKIIETKEMENEKFVRNEQDRCYWCKRELFSNLLSIASKEGLRCVVDGTNVDDTLDFRPGVKAAKELGIRSPLKEAGFTKLDIRELSKKLGLPTWHKPSFACLSSRFPYGDRITLKNLQMVDKAEEFLIKLGFTQVRVRHHNFIARIEIPTDEMEMLLQKNMVNKVVRKLKSLGYKYITLDLEGYRTGSMNEVLT